MTKLGKHILTTSLRHDRAPSALLLTEMWFIQASQMLDFIICLFTFMPVLSQVKGSLILTHLFQNNLARWGTDGARGFLLYAYCCIPFRYIQPRAFAVNEGYHYQQSSEQMAGGGPCIGPSFCGRNMHIRSYLCQFDASILHLDVFGALVQFLPHELAIFN